MSVDEALNHPFFNRVRKPHRERESLEKIVLDFEAEMLDRTRLRQLFVDIILDFEHEKEAIEAARQPNAGATGQ